MSSRNWCFTQNNYLECHKKVLDLLECRYLVYGEEVGESGTPHLQGFVAFDGMKRLAGVRKILPAAHWEVAKGTAEQAAMYCKKDGKFVERGEVPSRKRAGAAEIERWDEAREAAKKGRFEDIPSDIFIRYYNSLHKIAADAQPKPESLPTLDFWWFCGPTGSGKSLAARTENPDYYIKNINKWWDGYQDQPCVIIEEWDPTYSYMASFLKQWADHHPFAAEVKGGSRCLRPARIIITSNYSITDCFPNSADHEPLLRRFQVREFGGGVPDSSFPSTSPFFTPNK